MQYAITRTHTPLFNTKDLAAIYAREDGRLPLDEQKLLRPVETVLFPNTKCVILEHLSDHIYQVATNDYPGGPFFVDSRFLIEASQKTLEREKVLPPKAKVIEKLTNLVGTPYVWGGNWNQGIPEMIEYYPPKKKLDTATKTAWLLQGVDCSGLIYQATDGFTPRNTSQLLYAGQSVPVYGMSPEEICSAVQPLDAIVWKGHVIFVLNPVTAIESIGGSGVITIPLEERFSEIMVSKKPVDTWVSGMQNAFVVRRWHL